MNGDANMYDEIVIGPRGGDESWANDHAALEEAWRQSGVHPLPVARFSTTAEAVGHFLLTAGIIQQAFAALRVWIQGRAGRTVHIRLADGTELKAGTPSEIDQLASTVSRLRHTSSLDRGCNPESTDDTSETRS